MKKLLSWIVYVPLQIAAVPLAVVGGALVAYKQIVVSQRLGVSQTAIEILNGRWTLDWFGMRADPGAVKLAAAVPNTSTFGLQMALFPLWLKAKIAGEPEIYPRVAERGHESMVDLVPARTVYFDEVLSRRMPEMEQFVMLGAGMDTRTYGAIDLRGTRAFEVDMKATQDHKRAMVDAAGIDASHVTFVSVDFSNDDLFERLRTAGFDASKKTLFLWEGVTLYLNEEAVRSTMVSVSANAPAGSVLLADIYSQRFIGVVDNKATGATLRKTNESMDFGLPFASDWESSLERFVASTPLSIGETFFMGSATKKGPFVVVAEMIV